MSFPINTITENLKDLARPNKYKITIAYLGGDEVSILAKASSVPGKTMGAVEVYSQGRKIPLAGDTVYNEFPCTFYVDPDHNIREKMENWHNEIDNFAENKSNVSNLTEYGKEIRVEQLDRNGSVKKTYVLHYAWPSSLGEITLGADTNDTVEEFEVTFQYVDYSIE